MNKFKKNQVIVYAIVLMLVVAGYLSYIENDRTVEISSNTQNTTNIGDATLVSNNETNEKHNADNQNTEENSEKQDNKQEKDNLDEDDDSINTSSQSNTNINADEYFANSKIEREKMYSQMLETYQKILENSNVTEEQKSVASKEITKINNTRNAIMICENLISIKGFEEAVILANGENVNVVVEANDLTSEEIAQIQNIINREMDTNIENIHIMKK